MYFIRFYSSLLKHFPKHQRSIYRPKYGRPNFHLFLNSEISLRKRAIYHPTDARISKYLETTKK